MAADRLDVVIFGATGFAGKHCVIEAVNIFKDLRWGVAGRNRNKLEKVIKDTEIEMKTDLSRISILIADIEDETSLCSMVKQAKVIVNCCGPYRYYGEPVIKACIDAGTHHVDISAEPQYMEKMRLDYSDRAKERGVYIVSACAFASIPADLGAVFVEKHFDGMVQSLEIFMELWIEGRLFGPVAHYGTWESLMTALSYSGELKGIRSKLNRVEMPTIGPKLKRKITVRKSPVAKAFYFPFPGVDESVVSQSQRIFYELEKKQPVQVKAYLAFRPFFQYLGALIGLGFLGLMTRCSLGLYLILKFPRLMSVGFISKNGPSKERMEKTKFQFTLHATGWSKENLNKEYNKPLDKKLIAKVSGSNPAYGATCIGALVSALTILTEKDKMPSTGGVYPPGAAFGKTNIISELGKYNGFHFEIVESL